MAYIKHQLLSLWRIVILFKKIQWFYIQRNKNLFKLLASFLKGIVQMFNF